MNTKILTIGLAVLILTGCYFDNAEDLYPQLPGDCDPTAADYTANVQPIIQQTCYNCHNSSNASGLGAGIDLEDTNSLIRYVNDGSLLGSIEHSSAYSPMPKGGGKLTDCQIETIKTWINNGATTN